MDLDFRMLLCVLIGCGARVQESVMCGHILLLSSVYIHTVPFCRFEFYVTLRFSDHQSTWAAGWTRKRWDEGNILPSSSQLLPSSQHPSHFRDFSKLQKSHSVPWARGSPSLVPDFTHETNLRARWVSTDDFLTRDTAGGRIWPQQMLLNDTGDRKYFWPFDLCPPPLLVSLKMKIRFRVCLKLPW